MAKKETAVLILVGLALTLYLLWRWLERSQYRVFDPSNNAELAAQFARMNPGLGA